MRPWGRFVNRLKHTMKSSGEHLCPACSKRGWHCLRQCGTHCQPNSKSDFASMCVSTINEICVEMNVPFYTSRHFKAEKTVDELKRLLYDLNALNRWAAVDSLAEKNHKDIVPKLIEVIKHDNSLCVR